MAGAKMHDDEPDIDADLVRRLLAGQFPRWAGLPLAPVASSGTDNAMFRLGDELAVRLPRIGWAVGDVAKEQRWLPYLAPQLPLAVPEQVAVGEPAHGYAWPWAVCRWLAGENPVPGQLADPQRLAVDLGRFVRALHGIDAAGGPPATRGVPLRAREALTRDALAASRDLIDTGPVAAAWETALAAPEWTGPPVWIHADLAPGNVLVADGRLTAVIDFGALGVGDPACDLLPAWNLLPAAARGAFRDAVGVDDATWARGRGWALSVALVALPYYETRSPVLAAASRYVIGQVLAGE